MGSYVIILFLLFPILLSAEKSAKDISNLQIQLKNLRESLYQAENYPGQKGLDQVKYYQNLINETEEELLKCGAAPLEDDVQNNVPWTHFEDDSSSQYGSPQHTRAKTTPLNDNAAEILNIDEKLNWLLQNKDTGTLDPNDVLTQMKTLMQQRERLLKSRKKLKEDPSVSIAHYKQKKEKNLFKQDSFSKDPVYISILDEQLQTVYNQIFFLREKILNENNGERVKELGQKISQLEREEKKLKSRLMALGQQPKPPRIIDHSYRHALQGQEQKYSLNLYSQKLSQFIAELTQKIQSLKREIAQASTGEKIATLGQKLSILNQQLFMAQADLSEDAKTQKKQSPALSLKTPQSHPKFEAFPTAIKKEKKWHSFAKEIKKSQNQPLWSEVPKTRQQAQQMRVVSADPYNAKALSRNVDVTSIQAAQQAEALRSINAI